MDFLETSVLIRFFNEIDMFLIILVRILGFLIIVPVLSTANIPGQVKTAAAVVMAYLIFISGKVAPVAYGESVAGFLIIIVKEFITGFAAGFVVNLIFSVFYFVGQMIDYQIGFAMVSILDPLSQIQVPITGNMLYLFITVILVASGGLNAFLAAFFYSYDVLPAGASVLGNPTLMAYMTDVLVRFLLIGVSISMPVVGAILILDVALGVLVKAVPQMNIFVVGMPVKVFIGLLVFMLIMPLLGSVYNLVFEESFKNIVNVIDGMAPR